MARLTGAPVVMKFGGTSVQDAAAIARVAGIVAAEQARARAGGAGGPLVVVSAFARVTDALLGVADHAVSGRAAEASTAVDALRARHLEVLHAVTTADGAAAIAPLVAGPFEDLRALARALEVLGEVSPRSRDAIAAIGELVSSRIVAAAFAAHGIDAAWVDARQMLITSDDFGAAVPLPAEIAARVFAHAGPLLERGAVPVVGGYVGATASGVTTTLGRGGSDYSAALFGAALDAREIQIWTDVDGMLTGDPRLVADPLVVPRLSFDEASELAYFGAKVLHPSTIQPAVARNLPVRILNSRNPSHPGTRIAATSDPGIDGPVAIACKRGVTRIDISSTRMLMAHGFLQRVFDVFARHRTAVDVVTTSEVSVSVTIDDERRLEEICAALSEFADVRRASGRAIACVVGERLAADPTLSARIIASLEGLPLEMISQGGSRKNVTVVLPDEHASAAMTRLHQRFFGHTAAPAARGN